MDVLVVFATEGDDVLCKCCAVELEINDVMPFNMIFGSADLADIHVSFSPCLLSLNMF